MIRSKVLAFFLLVPLAFGAFAQSLLDFSALNTDVTTLFTSIGQDLSPRLHQLAISGNDFVGEAKLKGRVGLTLTFAGVSIATMDGFSKALGSNSPNVWKFSLLSIPNLVSANMPADVFTMATTNAFAIPAFRFGAGLALPGGFEAFANGFYLSTAMTESAVNAFGASMPIDLKKLGADMGVLSAGGLVRKVILSDSTGYFTPSVSLGLSYTYSSFDFSVSNFSFGGIGMQAPVLQGLGTIDMSGSLGFHSRVNTIGALFSASKTVLWVLTPFAKVGAYYHITDYSSNFDVKATVTSATTSTTSATTISQTLSAPVSLHSEDASLVLSGGLEVKIVAAVLTIATSLDLERPIVQLPSLSNLSSASLISGTTLNGLGLTLALRVQI
ncbi:MAG: hypothetical protein M0001_14835 [Treponema sp.]|nr:hypothetical protein [Treponema sp.]